MHAPAIDAPKIPRSEGTIQVNGALLFFFLQTSLYLIGMKNHFTTKETLIWLFSLIKLQYVSAAGIHGAHTLIMNDKNSL